jgi:hypothetical protein
LVVKETVSEVIQRVVEYRKTVYVGASYLPEFLKGEKDAHLRVVGGSARSRAKED